MDDLRDYLDRVAAGLPFVAPVKNEVITELADHVEDSIAERMADGQTFVDAADQVLRRMGPAEQLARSIVHAHQTPSRLLAAAGVGVTSAVGLAFSAGIQIVGLTLLVGLVFFVGGMLLPWELNHAMFDAFGGATIVALWLAISYAIGRGVPFRLRAYRGARSALRLWQSPSLVARWRPGFCGRSTGPI